MGQHRKLGSGIPDEMVEVFPREARLDSSSLAWMVNNAPCLEGSAKRAATNSQNGAVSAHVVSCRSVESASSAVISEWCLGIGLFESSKVVWIVEDHVRATASACRADVSSFQPL